VRRLRWRAWLGSGRGIIIIRQAVRARASGPGTEDLYGVLIISRFFITGFTDGLGLSAARTLFAEGHRVVLHARSQARASALSDLAARSAGVVIGDLSSAAETRAIAGQLQKIGRMESGGSKRRQ
jgi:hypothetical protein